MMIVGIDPGKTIGVCRYDTEGRRVVWAENYPSVDAVIKLVLAYNNDAVVIEKPVAHGPTRPDVVETAWIAGIIYRACLPACAITRLDVKTALITATHNEVQVRNDATAWAALCLLHGGDAAGLKATKKRPGGCLGPATGHARAALAAAYAWWLLNNGGGK